jgi:pyridoxine 5'-phosphate synthase PdxJ
MAEPLGDFVDAVAGLKQRRRDQVPDLVRANGRAFAASASWLNRSVRLSGRIG